MRGLLRLAFGLGGFALALWLCGPAAGQSSNITLPGGIELPGLGASSSAGSEKKFEDIDKFVKGAKEYEGLFKLYQKDKE